MHAYTHIHAYTYIGWGKSRFIVVSTQNSEFILVLFINYCVISHANSCEPTFANPVYILIYHTYIPIYTHIHTYMYMYMYVYFLPMH